MRTILRYLCIAVCVFLCQEVATNRVGLSLAAQWSEGDFEEKDEHEGGYHAFKEWRRAHKAGEVSHAFSGKIHPRYFRDIIKEERAHSHRHARRAEYHDEL